MPRKTEVEIATFLLSFIEYSSDLKVYIDKV